MRRLRCAKFEAWFMVAVALLGFIVLYGCGGPASETSSTDPSAPGASAPPSSDKTPPSTPGALSATLTSSSQVNLTWSASTDDVAVAGYRIYRSGVSLATVGNVTTYQDIGLSSSTTYSYSVQAL